MDLNSPDTWSWVWFVMAAIFIVGEMLTPATFFLLPFGIGAAIAGACALADVPVSVEWIVFVACSVLVFAGLWPLGRRLDRNGGAQQGVGANRWVGQNGVVTQAIPQGGFGRVRLEREIWRAEGLTGVAIDANAPVVVARVVGTRLVVIPAHEAEAHKSQFEFETSENSQSSSFNTSSNILNPNDSSEGVS